MWEFITGYLVGCFCMLLLARMLASSTLKTHEIKPIAAHKINGSVAPMARLHQIHATAIHLHDYLEALGEETVELTGAETSDEADIARDMVFHAVPVRETLDKLY